MPFRIQSILVATDLSRSTHDAVRGASALAELTEAALHVVHVLEPGVASESNADQQAEAALAEQLRVALPQDSPIASSHVRAGRTHEVILERASTVLADLIVIGPHRGAGGAQRLGTTADRLVRTSDVPCLIVQRPVSLPLRTVLAPIDFSDAARGALDVAMVWTAALRFPSSAPGQTQLHVVHIASATSSSVAEATLGQEIAAARERTGSTDTVKVTQLVIEGGPAQSQILLHARKLGADLIVLGTHGESALARALIGSVSSAVARAAESSVLLVPPGYWQVRQTRELMIREAATSTQR